VANFELLKTKTNFDKLERTDAPIDSVINMIDTPYDEVQIAPERHFMKTDDNNRGQFKTTIVNSKKVALIWYAKLFIPWQCGDLLSSSEGAREVRGPGVRSHSPGHSWGSVAVSVRPEPGPEYDIETHA
jgi:hypothetical protein